MINNAQDFQKLGQSNVEAAVKTFTEWNKSWQAIAAEMTDYSKRSFEEGTAACEKLLNAKSMEQALEIQTTFARRAYEDYVQQYSKITDMYASVAKEAYRPMEQLFPGSR